MDLGTVMPLATLAVGTVRQWLKQASEGAAKKSGEALVDWLRKRIAGDERREQAVAALIASPENEHAVHSVARVIDELVSSDPSAYQELQALMAGTVNVTQTAGANAIQIGQVRGDVAFGNR
jgi:Trp operon repressor